MDPKVRKISQRLKSTNEWNDRLKLLNQYHNNTLQSTENTTVEVFDDSAASAVLLLANGETKEDHYETNNVFDP